MLTLQDIKYVNDEESTIWFFLNNYSIECMEFDNTVIFSTENIGPSISEGPRYYFKNKEFTDRKSILKMLKPGAIFDNYQKLLYMIELHFRLEHIYTANNELKNACEKYIKKL